MIFTSIFGLLMLVGLVMSLRGNQLRDFTVDNTLALRGVLAVSIVLFHYCCFYGPCWEPLFEKSGAYICGAFFLMSGYGMGRSWKQRGDAYLRRFWRGRLGTLLPVWLTASIVCAIMHRNDPGIGIREQLYKWITNGDTLSYFTWFIDVLMVCYVSFYLSARILKRPGIVIIALWILTIGQILLFRYGGGHYYAWYISQLAMPVGFTIAWYEQLLTKRRMYPVAIGCLIGFIAAFIVYESTGRILAWITAITLFSAMLYFMVRFGITLNIKALRYLGTISLEIYVIHGLLTEIAWNAKLIPHYSLCVMLVGGIVAAAVFHTITSRVKEYLCK
ncbi:MAG: acyltransferase family protein [Muribaculaceae bacterium]